MTAFDGLRGIAVLLVVLGHAGTLLWPQYVAEQTGPYAVPYLRGLLGGGAVVVFFVIGGFIVANGLLRETARRGLDPLRFMLRRVVRLGVQLGLLAVVLVVVQLSDPRAPGAMIDLVRDVLHTLTYTVNFVPLDLETPFRTELSHLWYLSVQQQVYLALPLFILLFARRRMLGIAVLAVLVVVVYLQRQDVAATDWIEATTRTTTRSDGIFWGMLLALAVPVLGRFTRWSLVLAIACVGMAAAQLSLSELGNNAFLGPWSLVSQLFIGLAVVAVWLQRRPSAASRVLSAAPLTWLGRNSLSIYVWHMPIFVVVVRQLEGHAVWQATVLAFVTLGALTVLLERVVERPTRRLLASHPLFQRPKVAAS